MGCVPGGFRRARLVRIGGNIATNAGGIRVVRYGNTREWIAGLTVVTGAGEVLELNRGLVKNSSGYDLRHLMIGSEGTLGIVVEATVKLTDPPPPTKRDAAGAALVRCADAGVRRVPPAAAGGLRVLHRPPCKHVLAHGAQPRGASTHPYYVVTEFASERRGSTEAACDGAFEHCMEQGWVSDGVISASDAQAAQLWRLREGITESLAKHVPYKNDISVRSRRCRPSWPSAGLLGEAYPHFDVVWFGHIGDGNLHINVLKPDRVGACGLRRRLRTRHRTARPGLHAHGGSISAEHGIGLVKKSIASAHNRKASAPRLCMYFTSSIRRRRLGS
jgi:FAD/FMN-containing dehydrogenase